MNMSHTFLKLQIGTNIGEFYSIFTSSFEYDHLHCMCICVLYMNVCTYIHTYVVVHM